MRNEIYEAAKFLSNLLRLHTKILSQEQLERFQSAIEAHLAIHYEHHWFPDKPNKGSAYRCIRINHKMDPIISKAGLQCGLDQSQLSTIFPNELTLWIDPREVAYRIGENGSICVLFDGSEHNSNGTNLDQSSINRSPNIKTGNNTNVNNKPRVNTNHNRASPTDTASLSSTTSTMSSPSPSSSPDQWCRTPAQSMDQNHQNGHHVVRRASPTAAAYGQAAHNFHSSMSDLNFGGGQGNMAGYSFTPSARNTNGTHFLSGPSQSTWGSPSMRTDSPNGWGSHYNRRQHSSHHQYSNNGWDAPHHQHHYGGLFGDSNGRNGHHNGHGVVGGHHHGHHHHQQSHLSPNSHHNANLDHVAAYVSS